MAIPGTTIKIVDPETFKELKELGVSFDVRKVPNDSKGNMEEILKKAQEEINKQ